MNRLSRIMLLLVGGWVIQPATAIASEGRIHYMCDAILAQKQDQLYIRGLARWTQDGLVMADFTCPAAIAHKTYLPLMLLIDPARFKNPEDGALFSSKTETHKRAEKAIFQIIVKGKLRCVQSFKFEANEQDEIVSGNGYGGLGLIKCKVSNGLILKLYEIQ